MEKTKSQLKTVILSPHTDDGEISAGGTIARFIEEGQEVYYVAFSSCEKSIPDCYPDDILKVECQAALNELGLPQKNIIFFNYDVRDFLDSRQKILDDIISLGKKIKPDLVICPSSFDVHQDHQVIYSETVRGFKKTASIWGMEHPWNNLSFRTDIFVELSKSQIQKKIRAIKKYISQQDRPYVKDDYIYSCAYARGINIEKEFAEVFECIRMKF